jgi:hypothetical protein
VLSKQARTPSRPGAASRRKIIAHKPEIEIGWNPKKVAAFERAFWEFAAHVRINSKEKGGNYPIIKGLYEGQKRFIRALFDGLAQDRHTIKCLKSRQLGMSTIVELFTVFWLGVHDGMLGGLVFDTGSHTAGARVRIKNLIANHCRQPRRADIGKPKPPDLYVGGRARNLVIGHARTIRRSQLLVGL